MSISMATAQMFPPVTAGGGRSRNLHGRGSASAGCCGTRLTTLQSSAPKQATRRVRRLQPAHFLVVPVEASENKCALILRNNLGDLYKPAQPPGNHLPSG